MDGCFFALVFEGTFFGPGFRAREEVVELGFLGGAVEAPAVVEV